MNYLAFATENARRCAEDARDPLSALELDLALAEQRRRERNDAIYVEAVRTWFRHSDPPTGEPR